MSSSVRVVVPEPLQPAQAIIDEYFDRPSFDMLLKNAVQAAVDDSIDYLWKDVDPRERVRFGLTPTYRNWPKGP